MITSRLFLYTIIINFVYIGVSIAGWSDFTPVSINGDSSPGEVNPHSNSGGRRIVRIADTTIALAAHINGDQTYRSTDNGASWSEIDNAGNYSGCLITGPNSIVYHFYRYSNNIYMVRFKYDSTPPPPVSIFGNVGYSNQGAYRMLNATVDKDGVIYVVCHWGDPDQIYVLYSSDGGDSWSEPNQISNNNSTGWQYPHIEVTSENLLVCTFVQWGSGDKEMYCCTSSNRGETWNRVLMSQGEDTYNPALLTVGSDTIFVFAQTAENIHKGMVCNISYDRGNTWSGWSVAEPTCGYGDPSTALGSDGTIYVALRSSIGTGVTDGTCGNQSRSKLILSKDMGQTWQDADRYYVAERTGTRSQIRYQTWWNYGGALGWIWMQYEDNGLQRRTYYDLNTDVQIYDLIQRNFATEYGRVDSFN